MSVCSIIDSIKLEESKHEESTHDLQFDLRNGSVSGASLIKFQIAAHYCILSHHVYCNLPLHRPSTYK